MSFAKQQMMTGATTIMLGMAKAWDCFTDKHGKRQLKSYPVQVVISQAEWIKALCPDHKPQFVREELDDHNTRYDVWKCLNCGLREMTPVIDSLP